MSHVQDRSIDRLTCSPVHYHCAPTVPPLTKRYVVNLSSWSNMLLKIYVKTWWTNNSTLKLLDILWYTHIYIYMCVLCSISYEQLLIEIELISLSTFLGMDYGLGDCVSLGWTRGWVTVFVAARPWGLYYFWLLWASSRKLLDSLYLQALQGQLVWLTGQNELSQICKTK